jgi:hypothetical protein
MFHSIRNKYAVIGLASLILTTLAIITINTDRIEQGLQLDKVGSTFHWTMWSVPSVRKDWQGLQMNKVGGANC